MKVKINTKMLITQGVIHYSHKGCTIVIHGNGDNDGLLWSKYSRRVYDMRIDPEYPFSRGIINFCGSDHAFCLAYLMYKKDGKWKGFDVDVIRIP